MLFTYAGKLIYTRTLASYVTCVAHLTLPIRIPASTSDCGVVPCRSITIAGSPWHSPLNVSALSAVRSMNPPPAHVCAPFRRCVSAPTNAGCRPCPGPAVWIHSTVLSLHTTDRILSRRAAGDDAVHKNKKRNQTRFQDTTCRAPPFRAEWKRILSSTPL